MDPFSRFSIIAEILGFVIKGATDLWSASVQRNAIPDTVPRSDFNTPQGLVFPPSRFREAGIDPQSVIGLAPDAQTQLLADFDTQQKIKDNTQAAADALSRTPQDARREATGVGLGLAAIEAAAPPDFTGFGPTNQDARDGLIARLESPEPFSVEEMGLLIQESQSAIRKSIVDNVALFEQTLAQRGITDGVAAADLISELQANADKQRIGEERNIKIARFQDRDKNIQTALDGLARLSSTEADVLVSNLNAQVQARGQQVQAASSLLSFLTNNAAIDASTKTALANILANEPVLTRDFLGLSDREQAKFIEQLQLDLARNGVEAESIAQFGTNASTSLANISGSLQNQATLNAQAAAADSGGGGALSGILGPVLSLGGSLGGSAIIAGALAGHQVDATQPGGLVGQNLTGGPGGIVAPGLPAPAGQVQPDEQVQDFGQNNFGFQTPGVVGGGTPIPQGADSTIPSFSNIFNPQAQAGAVGAPTPETLSLAPGIITGTFPDGSPRYLNAAGRDVSDPFSLITVDGQVGDPVVNAVTGQIEYFDKDNNILSGPPKSTTGSISRGPNGETLFVPSEQARATVGNVSGTSVEGTPFNVGDPSIINLDTGLPTTQVELEQQAEATTVANIQQNAQDLFAQTPLFNVNGTLSPLGAGVGEFALSPADSEQRFNAENIKTNPQTGAPLEPGGALEAEFNRVVGGGSPFERRVDLGAGTVRDAIPAASERITAPGGPDRSGFSGGIPFEAPPGQPSFFDTPAQTANVVGQPAAGPRQTIQSGQSPNVGSLGSLAPTKGQPVGRKRPGPSLGSLAPVGAA